MRVDSTAGGDDFIEVEGGTIQVLSPDTGTPMGTPIAIGVEPCIIGRGTHCHVLIDDPRASTSHCELVATDKGVLLVDLDSKNGTYVNQVRLGRRSAVYVTVDARIRCGQTWLAFRSAGREPVSISSASSFGLLVGRSVSMRQIYAKIGKIASHELNVLLTGETGSGKELVARAIHGASRRRDGPFVVVDCTTIPASLAESRLFGHERGSFTGAVTRGLSPFVEAQGGTIFFDELGELPCEIQPKLLRAIETREVQSVGSTRYCPVDVRIIAATRRDMHAELNAQRFRDDLYYRFAQVIVHVPALRERPEDIPELVARFLADAGDAHAFHRIDELSMGRLTRHTWPGNVRELRNVVIAAHAQSAGGAIDVGEFLSSRGMPVELSGHLAADRPFHVLKREMLDLLEREYFTKLHREAEGNLSEMARRSGVSRPMVREYLERHGLRLPDRPQ